MASSRVIPRSQAARRSSQFLSRSRWFAISGACTAIFLVDLLVVESNRLFDREELLRDHIFRAFHTALPFDALPYLHAVSLVGVVDNPYTVATGILAALLAIPSLLLSARRRIWSATLLLLSVLGSLALADAIKKIVWRPGVHYGLGAHSFPSGHAAGSLALFAAALFLLPGTTRRPLLARTGAVIIIALAVLTGLSSLTFHYPSEVLGGYALAGAWLTFLIGCLRDRLDREPDAQGR